MRDYNIKTTGKDEWLTPSYIFKSLGEFDLDPCCPKKIKWKTAKKYYYENGLEKDWIGRVWLNPPYGKETFKWVKKLSEHKNGIALIFARTETKGFFEYVWSLAHSVFFFKGRIKFLNIKGECIGNSPAPSVLISYSKFDTEKIKNSTLNGKLVILR